ncbi:hypothetical protein JCM10213v2_008074 [Rhodosporidiobolus nylandii]
MIDALLQFLLDEIAFDADSGTSPAALSSFVSQFYASQSSSAGAGGQTVDAAFLAYVWEQLVQQEDVRVGVLRPVMKGEGEGEADADGEGGAEAEAEAEAEADEGEGDAGPSSSAAKQKGKKKPAAPKTGKGAGKAKGKAGPKATHEMHLLPPEEACLPLAELEEQHGEGNLRVCVGEETAWVAITGSYARPTSLTPTLYSVLKLIASSRAEGVTAVRISKELGIEPKSVFHCVKIPLGLGLVKKFADIDAGSRTNRILHVRYLSQSKAWAVHCASDPTSTSTADAPPVEDDEDEGGWGSGPAMGMTPLSAQYLASNRPLVKQRVLKALRARRDGWMPHGEMAGAIGLHHSTSHNLRRLNFIITELANVDGLVEKITVKKTRGAGKKESVVQALRLVRREGDGEGGEGGATANAPAVPTDEDEEDDPDFYPVFGKTIERQVLELLMDADSRGMTCAEISHTLGSFAPRFVDAVLQRLQRTPPPSHLTDYTTFSVTETVGRVKQTRWFSLAGYLAFRRKAGVADEAQEARWAELETARVALEEENRGWAESAPHEGQYASEEDRRRRAREMNTMQMLGPMPATGAKRGRKPAAKKEDGEKGAKPKSAKAKGKQKAVDQDAALASDDDDEVPLPVKKKPTGRPRKNPLPPGVTESPYMRKKREKAEDEERERQGLPPILREKQKGGKKKKSALGGEGDGKKEEDSEAQPTPGPSSAVATPQPADTPVPATKKKRAPSAAKKKKATPTATAAAALAALAGEAGPSSSVTAPASVGPAEDAQPDATEADETPAPTPTAGPRKRGRPPKVPRKVVGAAAVKAAARLARESAESGMETAEEQQEQQGAQAGPSQPAADAAPPPSTPAAPASTPSGGAKARNPLKRPRIEPYVDIVVRTPAAKRRALEAEAVKPPGTSSPDGAQLQQHGGEVGVDQPQQPTATPATAGKKSTAAAAKSSAKTRDRRKASTKDNLTQFKRQQEVIDYTAALGGIFARDPRTAEHIQEFVRTTTSDANASQMDRTVLISVLETTVKRGALRKTVGTDQAGRRREIYYLPSVDLASEQMAAFLTNIPMSGVNQSRFGLPQAKELVVDVDTGDAGEPSRRWTAVREPPAPSEAVETVKEFFREEPGVLGRSHGVKHGLYARAQVLHKWLASFLFAQPDPSSIISLRDAAGTVISQTALLNSMPLGVFAQIVPLAVESDKLDDFLGQPQNLELPMSALPSEIDQLVKPRSSKRKAALWKVLDSLCGNRLLERLVPGEEPGTFVAPIRSAEVTHWRLTAAAPIYAVREKGEPLVAVHDLPDSNAVADFWRELQLFANANDKKKHQDAREPLEHDAFPPSFVGARVFKRDLCQPGRWRDSYKLSDSQRAFLVSLLKHDEELLGKDRADDLATWADALFAPLEVVKTYLWHYQTLPLQRKLKQQRKRRKTNGDEGDEDAEEEWEADAEEDLDPQAKLQRKLKGAAEQRERDWTTIVERFRTDHDQPDLDTGIVDYLHRRFVDPRRQIDAKQLDFELRRLLPPPEDAAAAVGQDAVGPSAAGLAAPAPAPADQQGLKTVVPIALIRKARLAKDPYAVSRQPNIRKRVRAVKTKNIVRRAPASPGSTPAHKPDPKPFVTGDQSEFLSVPLPPRPQLAQGQRLRNFYSPEQEDLLLDAVVVLKARSKLLQQRIAYKALEQLFKGHEGNKLGTHAKRLLIKPDEAAYEERLVAAWTKLYLEKKDELDDPNPTSMTQFDLASFVRCLRNNVDKRAIRLTRSVPDLLPEPVQLPFLLSDLDANFKLSHTDATVHPGRKWDKVWAKVPVASNIRDDSTASTPYAKVQHQEDVKPMVKSRVEEKTAAMLKLVLTTPQNKYDEAQGQELLKPFETHVDGVLKSLIDKHIVVSAHAEEARRLPGRNFSYSDRFFDRFDNRVDMNRLASASNFEKDMHNQSFEGVFPLIPTEGEMMAFFDLVSEGKVDVSIDTSVLTDKVFRVDDYLTRQANDDDIECGINIDPIEPREEAPLPLPEVLLPDTHVDEVFALEQARQLLQDSPHEPASVLALEVEHRIVAAGIEGVSLSDLMSCGPRATVLSSITFLTSPVTGSPLAYFAGTTSLSLVSSLYLSDWQVVLVPPPGSETENQPVKRILPCLWADLNGEVNLEMWSRAAGWVKGELLVRAGTTLPRIVKKAVTRHLLSPLEVQRILETLLKAGKVYRRRAGVEGVVEQDVPVDWETDAWYLGGAFW